jgi:hypothetical protein
VSILDDTSGSTIYYSDDPSPQGKPTIPPTGSTQLYTGPIPITTSTELRAIASASGNDNSDVATAIYVISALTPIVFQPPVAEKNETTNSGTVTTAAFNRPVTLGNLMVVWIWYKSTAQTVTGVTDSAGNSYQRAVGPTAGAGTMAGFQQEIWFAKGINGGSNFTVTATFTAQATFEKSISAHEYSGASASDPLDVTSAAIGATANASSGTATTSTARLIFGAAIFAGSGAAGPGFMRRSSLKNNVTEDGPITSLGSAAATFTSTAQDWIAQMITLK